MSRAARYLQLLAALALGACSALATPSPTETPWPTPTATPTPAPSPTPTPDPTSTPTPLPTELPTPLPTELPTATPTAAIEPEVGGPWQRLWPEPPARGGHDEASLRHDLVSLERFVPTTLWRLGAGTYRRSRGVTATDYSSSSSLSSPFLHWALRTLILTSGISLPPGFGARSRWQRVPARERCRQCGHERPLSLRA